MAPSGGALHCCSGANPCNVAIRVSAATTQHQAGRSGEFHGRWGLGRLTHLKEPSVPAVTSRRAQTGVSAQSQAEEANDGLGSFFREVADELGEIGT